MHLLDAVDRRAARGTRRARADGTFPLSWLKKESCVARCLYGRACVLPVVDVGIWHVMASVTVRVSERGSSECEAGSRQHSLVLLTHASVSGICHHMMRLASECEFSLHQAPGSAVKDLFCSFSPCLLLSCRLALGLDPVSTVSTATETASPLTCIEAQLSKRHACLPLTPFLPSFPSLVLAPASAAHACNRHGSVVDHDILVVLFAEPQRLLPLQSVPRHQCPSPGARLAP